MLCWDYNCATRTVFLCWFWDWIQLFLLATQSVYPLSYFFSPRIYFMEMCLLTSWVLEYNSEQDLSITKQRNLQSRWDSLHLHYNAKGDKFPFWISSGQWIPGIHLSLLPKQWDHKYIPPCLGFIYFLPWVVGIELKSLSFWVIDLTKLSPQLYKYMHLKLFYEEYEKCGKWTPWLMLSKSRVILIMARS